MLNLSPVLESKTGAVERYSKTGMFQVFLKLIKAKRRGEKKEKNTLQLSLHWTSATFCNETKTVANKILTVLWIYNTLLANISIVQNHGRKTVLCYL